VTHNYIVTILDKTEIQNIFKLVKLSADFNYIDYVLAFDEEMVASAIGEKYGSNNIESGRNFLEKVINIPLYLPQASKKSLFYFLLDGILDNVLPIIDFKISQDDFEIFCVQFQAGVLIRLKTPRLAKRYQNALIFTLPILEDKVNIVDLMLTEGIRIFYPKMYNVIKNNAEIFLNFESLSETDLNKAIINSGFENLSIQEKESLKYLLVYLFPRIQEFLYENESELRPIREKSIAHPYYFSYYFSYVAIKDDIPDSK
jgi:predicted KAP-like P-loop ATPase